MTATGHRAARGDDLDPRAVLRCDLCHQQIPALGTHHMIGDTPDVFCGNCIAKSVLHRRFFPDCRNANHVDVFDHGTKLHHRTRAAARAYITTERNTR